MPPLPIVANTLRFTIEGTTPGHSWVNALHWGYTGPAPLLVDLNSFASDLFAAWVTNMAPLMLTASTIQRATCTDLSSTLGLAGEELGTDAGSRGTVELPGSTAMLISKSIGRRYRGGHPRSYLYCGIQTDLLDSSHWSAAFVLNAATAYGTISAAMTGVTHGSVTLNTEVVVSYVDKALNPVKPFYRPVPLVLPVIGFAAQPEIAIQRRRIGR